MIANLLPSIYTIEMATCPRSRSRPRIFSARAMPRAMAEGRSGRGHADRLPLWDGKAKLRARPALPNEIALFGEAKNNGDPSDGLMLVYLVELDGEATDEESVDPGGFPPART